VVCSLAPRSGERVGERGSRLGPTPRRGALRASCSAPAWDRWPGRAARRPGRACATLHRIATAMRCFGQCSARIPGSHGASRRPMRPFAALRNTPFAHPGAERASPTPRSHPRGRGRAAGMTPRPTTDLGRCPLERAASERPRGGGSMERSSLASPIADDDPPRRYNLDRRRPCGAAAATVAAGPPGPPRYCKKA
jgi:hypothetical protein